MSANIAEKSLKLKTGLKSTFNQLITMPLNKTLHANSALKTLSPTIRDKNI
jgi:hypothetical protein